MSAPSRPASPQRHIGLWLSLRLARRELRAGLKGFWIFLASLALGVAAITAVQSVARGVLDGLEADGRRLLGGDVALRQLYQPISSEQLAQLSARATALTHSREMRAMVQRQEGEGSSLVELKAVDATYPLVGEMRVAEDPGSDLESLLAKTEGRWGALVEPALLARLDLQVGDPLLLNRLPLTIRGTIAEEPDRLGGSGRFGLGPRLLIAADALGESGLERPGSMIYHHYRLLLKGGDDPEALRSDLEERFPDAAWRITDYRNAAPQIRIFVERLDLFLTLVGLTALLVGGVGVGNAIRAYLDGKLRTIALLKSVGATHGRVFEIYLAQMLILAGAGIGAGLLVGVASPALAAGLLSQLLPFQLPTQLYPEVLLRAAGFGLLTTLAFGIWPLARTRQVAAAALLRGNGEAATATALPWPYLAATVIAALGLAALAIFSADRPLFAIIFIVGAAVTMALFRLAAVTVLRMTRSFTHLRRPGLRLALANLHRPGAPTANSILSLGLGLTVLVAIALIQGNLARQVDDELPDRAPAFFFIDIQKEQQEAFAAALGHIDGTENLRQVPYMRGRIEEIRGAPAIEALTHPDQAFWLEGDRGVTYASAAPDSGRIVAGEWWAADYSGAPLLSVHKDLAEAFALSIGDQITVNLFGRRLTATVATIRELEWRSMQLNFSLVFSPDPLRFAPHTYLATVEASESAEPTVQRIVAEQFPSVTLVRVKEALATLNGVLADIGVAVRGVAGVTLLAGVLVLAGAIAAGHRRRVYESVILKVLGATRRELLGVYLLEYGLLGAITALIAGLLGSITAWAVITQVMESEWLFLPSTLALTLAGALTITLALGYVGTWHALGERAGPLLRNE